MTVRPLGSLSRVVDTVGRVWRAALQVMQSYWTLRRCDEVGSWTRAVGPSPTLHNDGVIRVGGRGVINSRYASVALSVFDGGEISIGDRAVINFGTAISAISRVTIGHDVTIGPYCILDDRHIDPTSERVADPIEIGDGCWLASRVVVLPGTRIGQGTVIAAGSVVGGEIPPRVVVGGSPARILRRLDPETTQSDDGEVTVQGRVICDRTSRLFGDMLASAGSTSRLDLQVERFPGRRLEVSPARSETHVVVFWTSIDTVVSGLSAGSLPDRRNVEDSVKRFVQVVVEQVSTPSIGFVMSWTVPAGRQTEADAAPGGVAWVANVANAVLMEALAQYSDVFVLNTERWFVGAALSSDETWAHEIGSAGAVARAAVEEICEHDAVRDRLAGDVSKSGRARWGGVEGS